MKTPTFIILTSLIVLVYALTGFAQTPQTANATPPPSLATPSPALTVPVAAPVVVVDSGAAKVQNAINIALAILAGLGVVAGAFGVLWGKLSPIIAKVVADVQNMKDRQDRQAANTGAMQKQIVDNARASGTPLDSSLAPPAIIKPGESGKVATEFLAFLGMIVGAALFLLMGCATDTGNEKTDKRGRITNAVLEELFSAATKIAISSAASAVDGYALQHGATALFTQAEAPASIDGGAAIAHVIAAAAGPAARTPVANPLGTLYAKASPQTPADKKLVINTIAAGLQQGAAQVIYSDSQP